MTKIRKAVFSVSGCDIRILPATKAVQKYLISVVEKPLIKYAAEEVIVAGVDTLFCDGPKMNARLKITLMRIMNWKPCFAPGAKTRRLQSGQDQSAHQRRRFR